MSMTPEERLAMIEGLKQKAGEIKNQWDLLIADLYNVDKRKVNGYDIDEIIAKFSAPNLSAAEIKARHLATFKQRLQAIATKTAQFKADLLAVGFDTDKP